ncbi:HpcH/HpaI aldolase/citrate lyase family protein [Candidatus Phytoplasma citri]|uniref:CoA ester lyase n=1 Tax=Candidatus Phytoplasma citri TaxID=180978 RepID=A0ABU8ZRD4_9MOLU|nr:CoA ester lyase [Candidatus Phytoplasma aurantifolia]MDO8060218.1 CoA ester lyase [Candidatus Phytoplasma aurantifolia]MDO8078771.1 CoA ester lyase [Candidatus Phytoplasma aurantifolia]
MKKNRKTMLFLPGNNPALFKDVISYKVDSVIFDLEDAIAVEEKDAARELTGNMISFLDYYRFNIETMVRINAFDTPFYQKDLEAMVTNEKLDAIRLPKVESKLEVLRVIQDIESIEAKYNKSSKIVIFCAIESAKGVLNALEIALSSSRVVGIALGGVDYMLNLQATKTINRHELFFARQMILHAARAADIDAIDCIYDNVSDLEGLEKEAILVKEMGFNGKSAIHPDQLPILNRVFQPSDQEIQEALKILTLYKKYRLQNQGVFAIDGKMIDKPVIKYSENILQKANISNPNIEDE